MSEMEPVLTSVKTSHHYEFVLFGTNADMFGGVPDCPVLAIDAPDSKVVRFNDIARFGRETYVSVEQLHQLVSHLRDLGMWGDDDA